MNVSIIANRPKRFQLSLPIPPIIHTINHQPYHNSSSPSTEFYTWRIRSEKITSCCHAKGFRCRFNSPTIIDILNMLSSSLGRRLLLNTVFKPTMRGGGGEAKVNKNPALRQPYPHFHNCKSSLKFHTIPSQFAHFYYAPKLRATNWEKSWVQTSFHVWASAWHSLGFFILSSFYFFFSLPSMPLTDIRIYFSGIH